MSDRKQALQHLRPILNLDNSLANEVETFQNEVLRPILKFQNELLKMAYQDWLVLHKQDINQMSKEKASALINHTLKTNKALRAQLFGMVLGLMEGTEFRFYLAHKRECSKRLSSMLIQRLEDQLLP